MTFDGIYVTSEGGILCRVRGTEGPGKPVKINWKGRRGRIKEWLTEDFEIDILSPGRTFFPKDHEGHAYLVSRLPKREYELQLADYNEFFDSEGNLEQILVYVAWLVTPARKAYRYSFSTSGRHVSSESNIQEIPKEGYS